MFHMKYLLIITTFAALCDCVVGIGNNETHHVRREGLQEIECLILLKHILYEKDAVDGPPSEWNCQLLRPIIGETNGHIYNITGLESLDQSTTVDIFQSGITRITIPGGVIDGDSIIIPKGAQIEVDNDTNSSPALSDLATVNGNIFEEHTRRPHARRLSTGTKRLIVIRIVDSQGARTEATPRQLSDSVFGTNGDPVNLKSQYEACSHGKLRFEPVKELSRGDPRLDADGVYEVKISRSASNVNNIAIREETTDQLNIEWPGTRLPENSSGGGRLDSSVPFDYAMYCMPPGTTGSWVAYAFANSWLTVYNDKWCTSVSAGMHELGHNLNLGHSGDGNNPTFPESVYGDQSGIMGFSYFRDDSPVMCFNAAKSWQLGWYSDKAVLVTPLVSSWSGRVYGFADYRSSVVSTVLLKLETGQSTDYYVNFNRKAGINSGTLEGGDRVRVVTQGGNGVEKSESQLRATLASGASYTINNFGGSGIRVRVTVDAINTSSSPAYAQITVAPTCTDDSQCRQQGSSSNNVCSGNNWACDSSTRFCKPSSSGGGSSSCNCNYQCNPGESATTCPVDCGNRLNLLTTSSSNNGAWGNMFDIRTLRDIYILGFDIHVKSAGKRVTVRVYHKTGSYRNFQQNAGAWTLLQTTQVTSRGTGTLTPLSFLSAPLQLSSGRIHAFYITLDTADLRYTGPTGTTEVGRVYRSDSNILFYEGIGKTTPFGNENFGPRIFNGRIRYVQANGGGSTNPSPRAPPPPPPPQNSPTRSLDTTMSQNNGQAGCMFSLVAKRDLEIVGFDIHARSVGKIITAEVYTKGGPFRGFEKNQSAWERIQVAVLPSSGINQRTKLPNFASPVSIRHDNKVSFYVTLKTNDMKYTSTTTVAEGSVFSSNSDLEFLVGTGNKYAFGDAYAPRIFNGRIKYRLVGNAATDPTASPTVTADLYPSINVDSVSTTALDTFSFNEEHEMNPNSEASNEPSVSFQPTSTDEFD